MKLCKVIKPGFFTTVQDLGRKGFQRYGVPVSGAMDEYAFTLANFLVRNDSSHACLEITMSGPDLEFLNNAQIAIAGAAFAPTLNGKKVSCWRMLQVYPGDVLSLGSSKNGCRAYLAVRGGINVPLVLGSRSTYFRGKFGGFQGRMIKTGDIIKAYQNDAPPKTGLLLPEEFIPNYGDELAIEVVLGPQSNHFTDEGVCTLFSSIYTATTESDRMGYRLEGPEVKLKNSLEMISDAIPVGAIQVPRNGKPIIIMRDAQTTGGYPKIAIAATPDVSRLGQTRPNDKIRFSEIPSSKAQSIVSEYYEALGQINKKFVEFQL